MYEYILRKISPKSFKSYAKFCLFMIYSDFLECNQVPIIFYVFIYYTRSKTSVLIIYYWMIWMLLILKKLWYLVLNLFILSL